MQPAPRKQRARDAQPEAAAQPKAPAAAEAPPPKAAPRKSARRPEKPPIATPARLPGEAQRRILASARAEFAEKGFAGARTESIVRAAGVNPNLLYHYFGSKERLFVAVMEEVYGDVRSHHGDLELESQSPEEAIRRLTEATFDLFVASDDVIRLLSTENIHHAEHIRGSARIAHLYDPLLALIGRQVERGREQGVFRAEVEAEELFITITGLSYFYLSNRHTLGVILRTDLNGRARRERRRRHIVDVVLSYLRHGADGTQRLRQPA
jgi:TetR/AcrR family transcriptional regulator